MKKDTVSEIEQRIFKNFAKKWDMHPDTVRFVYTVLHESGRQYSKVSRRLIHVNIKLSSRQLKYFYRKTRLSKRFGTDAENYNDIVNKKS